MARYIDVDNFRKTMVKRFGCIPCLTDYSEASRYDIPLDDALNLAPTADVIPKEFLTQKEDEAYARGYAEAKTEVTREIFEEIEKHLVSGTTYYGHCIYTLGVGTFAELKKKRTEEKE